MTPKRIAELRALCGEAAPGPWTTERRPERRTWSVRSEPAGERVLTVERWGEEQDLADASFIAAARTALPEALDEIKVLRAEAVDLSHDLHARETRALAAESEVRLLRADVSELEANAIEVGQRWSTVVGQLRARVAELEARLAGAAAELDEADAAVAAALGVVETVPIGVG